ncbi:hypothetical protein ACFQ1S_25210, partial [Kibdelosporangium lantanae]
MARIGDMADPLVTVMPGQETCTARHAIRTAHTGTHRCATVQLAETALTGTCGDTPECVARAICALTYAGELDSAEEQCVRALNRPDWRTDHYFVLLHARLKYLIGDCVLTAAMLTDLLAAEPPAEVRYPTVAWFVEALVHLDELDRA